MGSVIEFKPKTEVRKTLSKDSLVQPDPSLPDEYTKLLDCWLTGEHYEYAKYNDLLLIRDYHLLITKQLALAEYVEEELMENMAKKHLFPIIPASMVTHFNDEVRSRVAEVVLEVKKQWDDI